MRIERVGSSARDVLRGLRGAVLGAGPAIALGDGEVPADVPPGTAVVVSTSGSTGYPKSVVLSRSAITASALATFDRIGEGAWLLALPAQYVAGVQVLARSLVLDREPAILSGDFTPGAFVAAASLMRSAEGGRRVPSYTSLVPAQLSRLLDAADADPAVGEALRGFEAVLVGGQALAPSLRDRAATLGARVVRTYGSSETSGGCVYDGVPLRGVGVRIDAGEVLLSGPTLADGYEGDPERTAAAFVTDDDGIRWYRTGDAGTFDARRGVLSVTGRLDNVMVSGGINVSLDRVEQVVRRIEGFEAAVVVPVPDDTWGEACVVVVARSRSIDERAALASIRAAVGDALGAAARPRALRTIDEIPLLASGKPDRALLRAHARGLR